MAPRDVPYSQLVAQATANLRPARGMPQNQFVPPGLMGEQPGYPGSGGIRAPGMTPGAVSPHIDAALLRSAVEPGMLPEVGRLPAAAQPYPLTPLERQLGIKAELTPGMSPYLPRQTAAPSVPALERMKAMNLSMTPEGMAEHFRQLGFEAQVMPHDKYAEHHHPMLGEMVEGEGYNIAIKEPTTGDWHVLDPQSFEAADLTDILSDAAITAGSIVGANMAGAGALAGRQAAATAARGSALKMAQRKGVGAMFKGSGERAVRAAQEAAELAATPSTFFGQRVGGAIAGTVPFEGARQVASTMTDLPEEGAGPRIGRAAMELGASAVGEALDPVQSFRALMGARGRAQIAKYKAAQRAGAGPDKLAEMPLPEDYRATLEQGPAMEMVGLKLAEEGPEADVTTTPSGTDTGPAPVNVLNEQGRSFQNILPTSPQTARAIEVDLDNYGRTVGGEMHEGRVPIEGDYIASDEVGFSPEILDRLTKQGILEPNTEGSHNILKPDELREWTAVNRPEWLGERVTRSVETMGTPLRNQTTSRKGLNAELRRRLFELYDGPDKLSHETPFHVLKAKHDAAPGKVHPHVQREMAKLEGTIPEDEIIRLQSHGRLSEDTATLLDEGKLTPESFRSASREATVEGWGTLGPVVANKASLSKGLDDEVALGLMREMSINDVERVAGDWGFDVHEAWGKAIKDNYVGETESEKVFRYIADKGVLDEAERGSSITPVQPQSQPTWMKDFAKEDRLPFWTHDSESGRTGPLGASGWRTHDLMSLDSMTREHVSEYSPGPAEGSSRPVPIEQQLQREAATQQRAMEHAELEQQFLERQADDEATSLYREGRVTAEKAGEIAGEGPKPAKESLVVVKEAYESGDISRREARRQGYNPGGKPPLKEKLARVRDLQAKRAARKKAAEVEEVVIEEKRGAAKDSAKERYKKYKGVQAKKKAAGTKSEDVKAVEKDITKGLSEEDLMKKYERSTILRVLRSNPTAMKSPIARATELTHKAATKRPITEPWTGRALATNKRIEAVEKWLYKELEKVGLYVPKGSEYSPSGIIKITGAETQRFPEGVTVEDAYGLLGGRGHPRFTEASGLYGLYQTVTEGKIPDWWPRNIEVPHSLNVAEATTDVMKLINNMMEDSRMANQPLEKLLGKFATREQLNTLKGDAPKGFFSRLRGHVEDLHVLQRTTPAADWPTARLHLNNLFFDPDHKTGQYKWTSGTFQEIEKEYKALSKGWEHGSPKARDFKSENQIAKAFSPTLLTEKEHGLRPAVDSRIANALHKAEKDALQKAGDAAGLKALNISQFEEQATAIRKIILDDPDQPGSGLLGEHHPNFKIDEPADNFEGRKEAIKTAMKVFDEGQVSGKYEAPDGWDINDQYKKAKPTASEIDQMGEYAPSGIKPGDEMDMIEFQRAMHKSGLERGIDDGTIDLEKAWESTGKKVADTLLTKDPPYGDPALINRLEYLGYGLEKVKEMTPQSAWVRANFGIEAGSKLDARLTKAGDDVSDIRPKGDAGTPKPEGNPVARAYADFGVAPDVESGSSYVKAILGKLWDDYKADSEAMPKGKIRSTIFGEEGTKGDSSAFGNIRDKDLDIEQGREIFERLLKEDKDFLDKMDKSDRSYFDNEDPKGRLQEIWGKEKAKDPDLDDLTKDAYDELVKNGSHKQRDEFRFNLLTQLKKKYPLDEAIRRYKEIVPDAAEKAARETTALDRDLDDEGIVDAFLPGPVKGGPLESRDKSARLYSQMIDELHAASPGETGIQTETVLAHTHAKHVGVEAEEAPVILTLAPKQKDAKGPKEAFVSFFDPFNQRASLYDIQFALQHKSVDTLLRVYLHGLGDAPAGTVFPRHEMIGHIHPNSPAAKAGLQIGDKIHSVNEQVLTKVGDSVSFMEHAYKSGDDITIEFMREPEKGLQKVTFKLEKAPDSMVKKPPSLAERYYRKMVVEKRAKIASAVEAVETGGEVPPIGVVRGLAPASSVVETYGVPTITDYKNGYTDVMKLDDPLMKHARIKHADHAWGYDEPVEIEWKPKGGDLVVANDIKVRGITKVRNIAAHKRGWKEAYVHVPEEWEFNLKGMTLTEVATYTHAPWLLHSSPVEFRNLRQFSYHDIMDLQEAVRFKNRPNEPKLLQRIKQMGEGKIKDRESFVHSAALKDLDMDPDTKMASARGHAVLSMGYSTGMRVTEFTHLNLEMLETGGVLKLIRDAADEDVIVDVKLTAEAQRSATWRSLGDYLEERKAGQGFWETKGGKRQYSKPKEGGHAGTPLFIDDNGKRLSQTKIQRYVTDHYTKAFEGTRSGSFHTFRHLMATHLAENGASVKMIKEVLGHTDLTETKNYIHGIGKDSSINESIPFGNWKETIKNFKMGIHQEDPSIMRSTLEPHVITAASRDVASERVIDTREYALKKDGTPSKRVLKKNDGLVHVLDRNQIDSLLDAPMAWAAKSEGKNVEFVTKRNTAMLHALFSSGMRRGQLAKYKLENFNKLIADYADQGVELHRHLKAMKEWVDWRAEKYPDIEFKYLLSNVPSGTYKHKPMSGNQIYEQFKKLIRVDYQHKGITISPKVKPHSMRHSFATHMMDEYFELQRTNKLLAGGGTETATRSIDAADAAHAADDAPIGTRIFDKDDPAIGTWKAQDVEGLEARVTAEKALLKDNKAAAHAGNNTPEMKAAVAESKGIIKEIEAEIESRPDPGAEDTSPSSRPDRVLNALREHLVERGVAADVVDNIQRIDAAIKKQKGKVSEPYFTALNRRFVGTKGTPPTQATRVQDFADPDSGDHMPINYVTKEQFAEIGAEIQEAIAHTKAKTEKMKEILASGDISDRHNVGKVNAGEAYPLDKDVHVDSQSWFTVEKPAKEMVPDDIHTGGEIAYRMYPEYMKGAYKEGRTDLTGNQFVVKVNELQKYNPGVGLGHIIPDSKTSLGHKGTAIYFLGTRVGGKKAQYRLMFLDPKTAPKGVKAYIEIFSKTKPAAVSGHKYTAIGTVIATGERTDYQPGAPGGRVFGSKSERLLAEMEAELLAQKEPWRAAHPAAAKADEEARAAAAKFNIHKKPYRGKSNAVKIDALKKRKKIEADAVRALYELRESLKVYTKGSSPDIDKYVISRPGVGHMAGAIANTEWRWKKGVEANVIEGIERRFRLAKKAFQSTDNQLIARGADVDARPVKDAVKILDDILASSEKKGRSAISSQLKSAGVAEAKAKVGAGDNVKLIRIGDNVPDKGKSGYVGNVSRSRSDYILYRLPDDSDWKSAHRWYKIERKAYEEVTIRGGSPLGKTGFEPGQDMNRLVATLHQLSKDKDLKLSALSKPYKHAVEIETPAQVKAAGGRRMTPAEIEEVEVYVNTRSAEPGDPAYRKVKYGSTGLPLKRAGATEHYLHLSAGGKEIALADRPLSDTGHTIPLAEVDVGFQAGQRYIHLPYAKERTGVERASRPTTAHRDKYFIRGTQKNIDLVTKEGRRPLIDDMVKERLLVDSAPSPKTLEMGLAETGKHPRLISEKVWRRQLEQRVGADTSPDQYKGIVLRKLEEEAYLEGIVPTRPMQQQSQRTAKEAYKVRVGKLTGFEVDREYDAAIHYEALMHYASNNEKMLSYEGRGMMDPSLRKSMMRTHDKNGVRIKSTIEEWNRLGWADRPSGFKRGNIGEFLEMKLESRKLIKEVNGKYVLTTPGKKSLKLWHEQQLAHDKFFNDLRDLVDTDIGKWAATWARDLKTQIALKDIKVGDIAASAVAFLERHGESVFEYVPGKYITDRAVADMKKLKRPVISITNRPQGWAIGADIAKLTRNQTVKFEWSEGTWRASGKAGIYKGVAANRRPTVSQMIDEWSGRLGGELEYDEERAIIEHMDALIELRENPRIVPKGQERSDIPRPKPNSLFGTGPDVKKLKYTEKGYDLADLMARAGKGEVRTIDSALIESIGGSKALDDIMEYDVGAGRWVSVTKYEDGAFEYAVFDSRAKAAAWQAGDGPSDWSPYKEPGQGWGYRQLLSTIQKGHPGYTLGTIIADSAAITGGNRMLTEMKGGRSVLGRINFLEFRLNQMNKAMSSLKAQISEVAGEWKKGTATGVLALPNWKRGDYKYGGLGRYKTAEGRVFELIEKEATFSYGQRVGQPRNVKAQVAHKRTPTAMGVDELDASIPESLDLARDRLGEAIEAYELWQKEHAGLIQAANELEPVKKGAPGGRGGNWLNKAADKLRIAKPLKFGKDPDTGLVEPGGRVFQKYLDEKSDRLIKEAGGVRGRRTADGEAILDFDPNIRAEMKLGGMTIDPETGKPIAMSPDAVAQLEGKHKGKVMSNLLRPILKGADAHRNIHYKLPPAGDFNARWSPAKKGQFKSKQALSGHHADPIKIPIVPRESAYDAVVVDGLPTYGPTHDAFRKNIQGVAEENGLKVSFARWTAQFEGKQHVVSGIIVSKPGGIDWGHVRASMKESFSGPSHRAWDQESAKFFEEGEKIVGQLKAEYGAAFYKWWNSESSSNIAAYSGMRLGEKFWRAARDYALGDKVLRTGQRVSGKSRPRIKAFAQVQEGHRVSKVADKTEILAREDFDIEYRHMTGEEREAAVTPAGLIPGEGEAVTGDVNLEAWASHIMGRIGTSQSTKARRLIKALKVMESPQLSSKLRRPGENIGVAHARWKAATDKWQNKFRGELMKEVKEALDDYLGSPEGTNLQRTMGRVAKMLKADEQNSKYFTSGGIPGELADAVRMLRFAWPGSKMSAVGELVWKGRLLKRGARALGSALDKLAGEPSFNKARQMFLAHPELLNHPNLPEKIKKQLALGEYEGLHRRQRYGSLDPSLWMNWAARMLGMQGTSRGAAVVAGRRAASMGIAGMKGASPAGTHVSGGEGTISQVKSSIGAAVGPVIGTRAGGMPVSRVGPTRYRDRPLIKEAMQRQERIMSEKRKKKKKRELRLPRKLQRSS